MKWELGTPPPYMEDVLSMADIEKAQELMRQKNVPPPYKFRITRGMMARLEKHNPELAKNDLFEVVDDAL